MLDRITQLQPVYFNFRVSEFPEFGLGTETQLGLISQEVEKVFPELVTEDEEEFKRLRYNRLPFYMLQGIKELDQKVDELKLAINGQGQVLVNGQELNPQSVISNSLI